MCYFQSSPKNPTSVKSKTPSQRIKSSDFRAWDQFDADTAADHVDRQAEREEEEERKVRCNGVAGKTSVPVELSESERDMTDVERNKLAIHEKEKGNESFRSGDYEEAVVYYSHSLLLRPSIAAYNNRALMYIKLERNSEAVEDCTKVLEEDPNNVKALFRLATARSSLKQDDEAMADFERLLQLEPSNKRAQDQLKILRARHEARGPAGEKLLKKNRLHIVEVDGCGKGREEEEERRGERRSVSKEEMKRFLELKQKMDKLSAEVKAKKAADARREKSRGNSKRSGGPSGGKLPGKMAPDDSTSTKPVGQDLSSHNSDLPSPAVQTTPTQSQATPTPTQATPPVARVPLPPAVQRLKEEGNRLFRSGQYAAASEKYSKAVSQLEQENEGGEHSVSLATLLNNRAACSLKTGQCNSTISDCSRSISLLPLNHKAVLRRACAYEMKEKFQEAYMDYHLCLRLDGTVPLAQDAVTRLGRHLQDEYGLDWRGRLPPHPDADLVLGALRAAQSQHHTTPVDAIQTQLTKSEDQNQHDVTPVDAVQTQSIQSEDQNQHDVTPVDAVQTQSIQSEDQNQHDVTPVDAVQTQSIQSEDQNQHDVTPVEG
ncbi:Sperm-associated antigen 1, partial [Geodia barretti]